MRPIDADSAIERMHEMYCKDCNNYYEAKCKACWVDDAIGEIVDTPTIEAEPMRRGRWEKLPTSIRQIKKTNIPEQKCGLCGGIFCDIINSVELYNYCPNCGAKMEED